MWGEENGKGKEEMGNLLGNHIHPSSPIHSPETQKKTSCQDTGKGSENFTELAQ